MRCYGISTWVMFSKQLMLLISGITPKMGLIELFYNIIYLQTIIYFMDLLFTRIKTECVYDDEESRWILPAMKIEKTSLPAAGNFMACLK